MDLSEDKRPGWGHLTRRGGSRRISRSCRTCCGSPESATLQHSPQRRRQSRFCGCKLKVNALTENSHKGDAAPLSVPQKRLIFGGADHPAVVFQWSVRAGMTGPRSTKAIIPARADLPSSQAVSLSAFAYYPPPPTRCRCQRGFIFSQFGAIGNFQEHATSLSGA